MKIILLTIIFKFLSLWAPAQAQAQAQAQTQSALQCQRLFLQKSDRTQIVDLKSFGQAMTEGMLLQSNQIDLFDIYRKMYFGDPGTSVNKESLRDIIEVQDKYPELSKKPFREFEVSTVEHIYDVPESLNKYIRSQIQTAGSLRNSLLQIEANKGFWKKILDYSDQELPAGLSKIEQKEFNNAQAARYDRYLTRIISKTNRTLLADLKDENENYQIKVKSLFRTLNQLKEWMEKKERNTLPIRQAMVDIVNIAGFSNQATLLLLKSSNGIDKLEGLKKILDERDAIAMDLGYEGHFKELQKTLKIDFPTGFSKNENPHVNIQKFEKEVFAQDFRLKKSDFMRVRSLSLQESPFRSCLGGSDCSTRTYFYKALDPNFIYFTMTDSSFHSSGHVTIVLGEAYNPVNGNLEKIAFIDKLQNIPNQKINLILHAVALSVAEQGYKLALPLEVGDHNGLSNMDGISHYVSTQILPQLVSVYKGFNPHENEFEQKFENAYSRAYLNLDVKIYDSIKLPSGSEIKPGKIFQEFFSDKNLNQNKLINDLLALRYSNNFNEIIKYISSGPVVAQLEKIKLFSTKDFEKDLQHFMAQKEWPMNVRKQAYLEYLILKSEQNKFYEVKAQNIEEPLRIQVASEIKQWIHSTDKRKNKFAKRMLSLWNQSLMQGEIIILQFLCDLKFFDVNEKNEQGFSPLMTAIHVEQRQTIEWLLKNPHLNLNLKDSMGNNEIEQARLLGKNNIADEIEKTLREKNIDLQSRVINVSERNQDGSPIIDFVNIYPGNFMMGDINKHKVTLTKPFEIMSVLTTNSMWKEIIDLANDEFETKSPLKTLPGKFAGDDIPVQFVSYVDVMSWLDMLNQLSLVDRADVQNKIAEIFPGHQLGMKYRLPTEAEWEFVARARGLNTGSFTFGNEIQLLGSYAWYTRNSNYQPQNVGLKKPNFINGKPIYDLHGNLWEWNTDWYEEILEGGVDPQGPLMGTTRLMRGGSYRYYESRMTLHFRRNESPEGKFEDVGFRIVRTKSN